MKYKTYQPSSGLAGIVKFYWTLEIFPCENNEKQRIVPDGCIELAFILGDDIKRFTSDSEYIIQPRAMVLGQTVDPFYVQPVGYVHTFAASFYPYGFSNLISEPARNLRNKETAIINLFEVNEANELEQGIINAVDTSERINVLESFLLSKITKHGVIESIVKATVECLISNEGNISINRLVNEDQSQKRQLERRFLDVVGISPKQLSKLIRLQAALRLLVNKEDSFTDIAYKSNYYDQSHFIKDFKEFTGVKPGDFLDEKSMALTLLFNK